ncbi:MAG TPA: UvrD-helicase domain-containing protein, partial [Planctomycetota bacterium]|nr:UvrD-helicase domain-containing protein [Planctomycetota bacterium]
LAGAGSGKTRVITVRIAHLLAKRIAARNVLAVTFTNRAAREMRERVAGLVGQTHAAELTLGTFHAFCMRALREHGAAIGVARNFTICDASDQLSAFRGALRELRVPDAMLQPSALAAKVSLAKNRLIESEGFLEKAADETEELIGRAWQRYEEHLRRSRTLDFDDLLLFTLRLLKQHAEVRERFAERYRYVLVDEYQDTNGPQYEILRQIAGAHRNLCVVGDDDQSIYGWRGADVSKILHFERDFPGAAVVRLETNYRSTRQIVDAANRVIANNPLRHAKTLRSGVGDGPPISAMRLEDEHQEAEYIAREMRELVSTRGARLSDFAVLFRAAALARPFEERLRAHQLPYVLVGGMSFFDRKEVRDVLAFLRLVENPDDEVSLLRVINTPPRGVGKATVERALEHAAARGVSAARVFQDAEPIPGVAPAQAQAVRGVLDLMPALRGRTDRRGLTGLVHEVLDTVGYRGEVERLYPDPLSFQTRWAAVDEVLAAAARHERSAKRPTLASFLADLALSATDEPEGDENKPREAITLMTLHSAKGLEFERVYLVGLEEGLFPHARSVAEDGIEEERRLMYVGVTRARRNLTLTCTAARTKYGRKVDSMPSRFLYELKGEAPPPGWRAHGEAAPEAPLANSVRKRAGAKASKVSKAAKRPARKRKARR